MGSLNSKGHPRVIRIFELQDTSLEIRGRRLTPMQKAGKAQKIKKSPIRDCRRGKTKTGVKAGGYSPVDENEAKTKKCVQSDQKSASYNSTGKQK